MSSSKIKLTLAIAAVASFVSSGATAATAVFTGTTSVPSTNAAGNGTYNYGAPYGYAGAVTTYLIDAAGTNLSGAYTGGVDELLFDGSATGSTFTIAVDSTITSVANPAAIRFSDSGGAGKTYIFQRASTTIGSSSITLGFTGGTAGTPTDSYNSAQILGATLPASGSTSLVLETGFTGKVILRSVANNAATGTTTINGGTLRDQQRRRAAHQRNQRQ